MGRERDMEDMEYGKIGNQIKHSNKGKRVTLIRPRIGTKRYQMERLGSETLKGAAKCRKEILR